MDEREQELETLLAVVEPADRAATDASMLLMWLSGDDALDQIHLRGRLLSIEHEQGITQTEMQPIWDFLGLVYGPPQPPQ